MTSYFVTRNAFASQLAELRDCGGRAAGLEELEAFYTGPAGQPWMITLPTGSPPSGYQTRGRHHTGKYTVLLTFDDGWSGAVDSGSALLCEHSCTAILFVTTDFLGRSHFVSRGQLTRLDATIWHVGSHAKSHRMLSLLPDREIRLELLDSKHLLEDATGYEIQMLSIPSGAVDRRVRRIAQECGYRFIFDSEIRVNRPSGSPLKIGRIPLMRHTPLAAFRRYVQGRLTPERLRRAILQGPKCVLGLRRYETMRRRLLGEHAGQLVTHQS
jgi:peptidoglycan/xylan/chitin deacetylase (PgdA/CDA1 family)